MANPFIGWLNPGSKSKINTDPDPEESQRIILHVMPMKGQFLRNIENYDPDVLISRKGITVIDEMMRDDQVKATMSLKQNAPVSGGWHIEPSDDTPAAIDHAEFVKMNLDRMPGSVEDKLENITSALPYAFSVQEIVFERDNGNLLLADLIPHAPHNLTWVVDHDSKKVIGVEQFGGGPEPLPIWKALVYRWNSKFANPWGQTDLDAAYRPWFSKDWTIRHWNIHLERVALQRLIVKYEQMNEGLAKEMVDEWVESIGMAVPEGVDVDFAGGGSESKATGETFAKAIEIHDQAIARSILKQTLAQGEGVRVGSLAMARVHQDTLSMEMLKVQNDVANTVMTEQLIRLLIDLNYGPQEAYPKFKFEDFFPDDPEQFVSRYTDLIEKGGITPTKADEDRIRQIAGLPDREDDTPPPGRKEGGGGALPFEHDHFAADRELTVSEKRIDFKKLAKDLDENDEKAVDKLEGIVRKVEDRMMADIGRKFFKDGLANAREVNKFKVPYLGEFKREVQKGGIKAFEMGRADFNKALKASFAAANPGGQTFPQQVAAFERRWAARAEAVATEFGREVERDVRNVLLKALENGETQRETTQKLEQVFEKYLPGTTVPGGSVNPWRLENIVRTNYIGAYNQGRVTQSRDPDVADMMKGYVYSAVLDDRTSDICDGLDGTELPYNSPDVDRIIPPNHYACRSLLVEVFVGEPLKPTSSRAINSRMDAIQEGFK